MSKTTINLHFYGRDGSYIEAQHVDLGEEITMPTNATKVEVFSVTTTRTTP